MKPITVEDLNKMKTNFNGGYIVASQEAYNLLVEEGYKPLNHATEHSVNEENGVWMIAKSSYDFSKREIIEEFDAIYGRCKNERWIFSAKQFYINNGKLSWDKPEEIAPPLQGKDYDEYVNSIEDLNELPIIGDEMKPISIKDDNGVVYEFEKPSFKCSIILKTNRWFMGTIANYNAPAIWDEFGRCLHQQVSDRSGNNKFNLTPIKPKWYEDDSNFPALLIDVDNNFAICNEKIIWLNIYKNNYSKYRLATEQEVQYLHYEGKL